MNGSKSVTEDNDDLDDSNADSAMEQRPTPAPATFKVQKGILTSRSEIFAAMFSHGFSEGETGNLHISDMTPQVFKKELNIFFLISENVYRSSEIVFEIHLPTYF